MWILGLVVIMCFSGVAGAETGLLQKTMQNAVFHIPWEGNSVTWEFNLKEWGTWNVHAVSVNKDYISAPSGTDWEYVYLGKPIDQFQHEWMGGNHNNEKLKSLEFVVDGEVVKNGRYKVSRSLVIKETTDLIYPSGNLIVGSVIRRYVINCDQPNRLDFSQSTTWHLDMHIDRAYMCMLPIRKKYGAYFRMGFVEDGFIDGINSDQNKGLAEVTETYMYGIGDWGMVAGIKDLDSVDNYLYSQTGAFVWDLAKDHVKLYYPRAYQMGNRYVANGTVWDSESYFIVVPVED